ncbi:hypothetical protein EON63_17030 [archaeon]|nr:MAG: hypothetical protein EON63_17030 [archaeon]
MVYFLTMCVLLIVCSINKDHLLAGRTAETHRGGVDTQTVEVMNILNSLINRYGYGYGYGYNMDDIRVKHV